MLREAEFLPSYWRNLGQQLGVSPVDLDAIEADHSRDGVQRCLEEVIKNWKRNCENTWEKLVEAVSKCRDCGGGRNVAQKVQIKIGLGKQWTKTV